MRQGILLAALAAAATVSACSSSEKTYDRPLPPGVMALERVTDPADYPDFGPGLRRREAVLRAIDQSLSFFAKPSSQRRYPYLDVSHDRVVRSLQRFKEILASAASESSLNDAVRREFDVYRSVGCDGRGTVYFTGYYEPIFDGSLERTAEFRYPLYRRPRDLASLPDGTPVGRRREDGSIVPYYTREELDRSQALAGQELVWLRDRFEAYIVHIQGSAKIRLRDGRIMEIGYAGKTDRPYRSVALALVRDGKMRRSELSLERLRRYFRENPQDLDRYLRINESYVFFTEHSGGPFGSIGVPVTAMATVATDKSVFPAGAIAFGVTQLPNGAFAGFAMDQDTGGAIRSAGRCDLFVGTGGEAGQIAGHIGSEGRLFYIFLKESPPTAQR